MLHTRVVEFEGGGYIVRLTVVAVSVLEGTMRQLRVEEALLEHQASEAARKEREREGESVPVSRRELAKRLLRLYVYPSCISALERIENLNGATKLVPEKSVLEESFDEFCKLPDKLIGMWENAAIELNPHWAFTGVEPGNVPEPADNPTLDKSSSPGSKDRTSRQAALTIVENPSKSGTSAGRKSRGKSGRSSKASTGSSSPSPEVS